MEKLRNTIQQYGRWQAYEDYIRRIELNIDSDFPACIEISKSLLEGIARKICEERGQPFEKNDNVSKLVKLAFGCLGYDKAHIVIQQIGSSLATIGNNIGTLRNAIGPTAHGTTPEEIERKKNAIKKTSSDFLLASTEMICCFLIEVFETEFPRRSLEQQQSKDENNELFNQYLDDFYGEFEIGEFSYSASEIFFTIDPEAYKSKLKEFVDSLE